MNVGRGLSAGRSCMTSVVGYGGMLLPELLDGLALLGQLGRDHQVVPAKPLDLLGGPLLRGDQQELARSRRAVSRATTGRGSVVTEIRNRPSPAA